MLGFMLIYILTFYYMKKILCCVFAITLFNNTFSQTTKNAPFQKVLALDSNFVLAKQNLVALLATENGGGTKVTTPASNVASPANKQN